MHKQDGFPFDITFPVPPELDDKIGTEQPKIIKEDK